MFEIKTREAILEDLLELVPDTTNKNVGSLIYTTLSAMAEKMAEIYMDMDEATNNTFADTADREHLIRRAAERGLTPNPATPATYSAYFNCELNLDDRFEFDETTFKVLKRIESQEHEFEYILETEQTGTECNNIASGEELDYIEGDNPYLEEGFIDELLIPAQDEQETESFRSEYLESCKVAGFAGNVQAYIKAMNDIDGVGASKVEGVDNHVRIVFIDADYNAPNQTLKDKVQNIIDPTTDVNNWGKEYGLPVLEDYSGMGYGLAPINHSVLCEGPEEIQLNIRTNVALESGYTQNDVANKIEEVLNKYISDIRVSWKHKSTQKVMQHRAMAKLLDIEGIDDVYFVLWNELPDITLDYDQIPVIDQIDITYN